jgi:hypothetical protein
MDITTPCTFVVARTHAHLFGLRKKFNSLRTIIIIQFLHDNTDQALDDDFATTKHRATMTGRAIKYYYYYL